MHPWCNILVMLAEYSLLGAAVAQWGKRAVPQPQGRGFDPRSPH